MSDPAPACGTGLPPSFVANLRAVAQQLVLVTGGAGFLGSSIVRCLLQAGARVRVFDVVSPKPGSLPWPSDAGVEVHVGNLLQADDVAKAVAGCWCVIHVASPSPTSRNAALFQSVNVDGTRALLTACRKANIQRFVYTSSASVVFDGSDQRNLDETAEPPVHAMDDYTKSKLAAEQLVLSSNDAMLWTTAIRPHGIFGARDPHFLPVLAETGAKGKSKFQIGDGANLVDFTYVENVAYAHVLAAVKLAPNSPVNGQAYFITNREPIFFWEFIGRMHRAWGWTVPFLPLPVVVMKPMAVLMERIGELFKFKPTFTTQAINYAGSAHYYSSAKAVRDMGYQPPIDMNEAINRSLSHFWELRNKSPEATRERAALAKKNARKILPEELQGLLTSSLFKISLFLVVFLAALLVVGCKKTALVVALGVLAYLVYYWRTSIGVTPIMWQEKPHALVTAEASAAAKAAKNILLTGGNRGLGFHTLMEMLAQGYADQRKGAGTLAFTCRDESKVVATEGALRAAYPHARIKGYVLDLNSFDSVRALVSALKKEKISLDVLVHNAGAMVAPALTSDGFDAQFQSNYLSPFYFTSLLLKESLLAPACRILNVSSMVHRLVGSIFALPLHDLQDLAMRAGDAAAKKGGKKIVLVTPSSFGMYCRTKLLQILWAAQLQRQFNAEAAAARLALNPSAAVLAAQSRRCIVSVNPGAVTTDFVQNFLSESAAKLVAPLIRLVEKTPIQGVQSIIYAAFAQEMDNVGGVYVDNCRVCLPSALACNTNIQEEVWRISSQLCEQKAK